MTRNAFWNRPTSSGEYPAEFTASFSKQQQQRNSPVQFKPIPAAAEATETSSSEATNNVDRLKLNPKFIEDAHTRAASRRSQRFHSSQANSKNNEPTRTVPSGERNDYPISLYDTQARIHEQFANSVRQRNDTFYLLSFRRVSLTFQQQQNSPKQFELK